MQEVEEQVHDQERTEATLKDVFNNHCQSRHHFSQGPGSLDCSSGGLAQGQESLRALKGNFVSQFILDGLNLVGQFYANFL